MKNAQKNVPSILLIIVLIGFPQISESIFTPVLPALRTHLHVSAQTAQLTMSTYFIAFAIGVLFWGTLSDKIGRRLAMLSGIVIYLSGNLGLYFAQDFNIVLLARLIQAFGASSGSVITQTIMREAYIGTTRSKVFAKTGAAMSLAPALGPLIGGCAQTFFGYRSVFSTLILIAILILLYTGFYLPETRKTVVKSAKIGMLKILIRIMTDKTVLTYGLLVSGINGILFSYYAEAPFIFIEHFKMTSIQYGLIGIVIALSTIAGAMVINYYVLKFSKTFLVKKGLFIALLGTVGLIISAVSNSMTGMIIATFFTFWGLNITLPITLELALVGYENIIGTASGLFSFLYYLVISFFTYLMSLLHSGSIISLPIYVATLVILMLIAYSIEVRSARK